MMRMNDYDIAVLQTVNKIPMDSIIKIARHDEIEGEMAEVYGEQSK